MINLDRIRENHAFSLVSIQIMRSRCIYPYGLIYLANRLREAHRVNYRLINLEGVIVTILEF
jgi:hypothetical protein